MKDFTDITVVLDRSGSMSSVAEATVSGFDEFVKSQQIQGSNAALTLVQFDSQYDLVWNGLPINDVPSIKNIFEPRGMTALLDAVGRAIKETGERLNKLADKDKPNKVVCVIITDGFENASKEYTHAAISSLIEHQTSKYNWSFVFLGANQDAIASAAKIGIRAGWAATYNSTNEGTKKSFSKVGSKMSEYRCCALDSEALSFSGNDKIWTDKDREELIEDK